MLHKAISFLLGFTFSIPAGMQYINLVVDTLIKFQLVIKVGCEYACNKLVYLFKNFYCCLSMYLLKFCEDFDCFIFFHFLFLFFLESP
jgi:hypothetical protein